ncbi:carboxypeptidase regulatory-like domain-containing protein [Flavobacterium sp. CBA20B-1]|uniref:carboxypeptidase regulatory-like domain-containing protein n=1 Tax=unclassified Flavobacterium TaxID=196869 RepID=UPI002225936D|nr:MULTISPECIES: carboxypeptidase regulatory-like domain-containing protein [unclassified Flavobacterium]WCM43349.1 carboxypeptidase regulatory-like domain-containing protein [Flavobacterium sp. CBA20B-1]
MKSIYYYIIIAFSLVFASCSEDTIDGNAQATLTGSVRLEASNEPLKNVKISTTPASTTVFTDEDGNFAIEGTLPMGTFSVRAELKGYVTEYQSITISEFEQKVHLVFEMVTDESLNNPPTVPVLVSPKNLATNLTNNVELEWECSDPDLDTLTYKLIFTNNRTNNRVEIPNISTKKITMTQLDFGTTYTWQVVASDSINSDVFSEAYQFTVRKNPEYRYHFVRKNLGSFSIFATDLQEEISITAWNNATWKPRKNNVANKLAYLQTYNGQTHLFTADLDGQNELKISQTPLNGFRSDQLSFAWKADGSQFIFPSFDKLYQVNSNGTGQTQIYQTPNGHFITKCAWSNDGSKIAITTNDINGYQAKIIILDSNGNVVHTVLENVSGAMGGLDFDVTGNQLLYTHDVSGNEDWQYKQLDTRMYIYNITNNTHTDISAVSFKPMGSVDIDPIFSPNSSEIIFTNTSNDMISQRNIYKIDLNDNDVRTLIIANAEMADYE